MHFQSSRLADLTVYAAGCKETNPVMKPASVSVSGASVISAYASASAPELFPIWKIDGVSLPSKVLFKYH